MSTCACFRVRAVWQNCHAAQVAKEAENVFVSEQAEATEAAATFKLAKRASMKEREEIKQVRSPRRIGSCWLLRSQVLDVRIEKEREEINQAGGVLMLASGWLR